MELWRGNGITDNAVDIVDDERERLVLPQSVLLHRHTLEDDVAAGIGAVAEDDSWVRVHPSSGGHVVQSDVPHRDQRIRGTNIRAKWVTGNGKQFEIK